LLGSEISASNWLNTSVSFSSFSWANLSVFLSSAISWFSSLKTFQSSSSPLNSLPLLSLSKSIPSLSANSSSLFHNSTFLFWFASALLKSSFSFWVHF